MTKFRLCVQGDHNLRKNLKIQNTLEAQARIENLEEFLTVTQEFDKQFEQQNEEDADAILSLPMGRNQVRDKQIWHFEQSDVYTVKSGYQLGCRVRLDFGSSGLD